MHICGIRLNAKLVKEGSFRINAKLVKEELMLQLRPTPYPAKTRPSHQVYLLLGHRLRC